MNAPRGPQGPRISDRGGIRKSRHSTPTRIDRDGDIPMTSVGAGARGNRNRGNRGNRQVPSHRGDSQGGRGASSQPPHVPRGPSRANRRNNLTPQTLDKAITHGDIVMTSADAEAGGLVRISMLGLRDSTVFKNRKPGHYPLHELINWVEKQASRETGREVKIDRSKCQDYTKKNPGLVFLTVQPEFADAVISLDQMSFMGALMSIRKQGMDKSTSSRPDKQQNDSRVAKSSYDQQETQGTINILNTILEARWNRVEKTFDLSNLIHDPALVNLGVFDHDSTTKKFFPALMKLCEDTIRDGPKHEMHNTVTAISLANNGMSSLVAVSSIAATFPRLRHLVLSKNNLRIDNLGIWRWKFRDLVQLEVDDNPMVEQSNVRETLMKWYPKLQLLKVGDALEQVRDPLQIEAERNPIPIMAGSFADEANIAANFITTFFPCFDNDRNEALDRFYDNDSSFSLSYNSKNPRIHGGHATEPSLQHYVRSSRNLLKITHLPTRVVRLFTGKKDIGAFWTTLPKTSHPDPSMYPGSWMIECHSIPGVPDPSGQSPGGVAGLIISATSNFNEIDRNTGREVCQPWFHRQFVLGPGASAGSIRVVSDVWTIRQSLNLEVKNWKLNNPAKEHPGIVAEGYGEPGMGKSMEMVEKERLTIDLSITTGLILEAAMECLEKNNWDTVQAKADTARLKATGSIPNEWLLPTHQQKLDGVAGFGPKMGGTMADII